MIFSKHIELETSLSPQEIKRILRKNTKKEEGSFWRGFNSSTNKRFAGIVEEDYFELNRVIWYKNDFLPNIYGNVRDGRSGMTQVNIKFKLGKFVKIFLILFYSVMILLGIPMSFLFYKMSMSQDITTIIFPFMTIVILGTFIAVFHLEANYAAKILKKLITK